MNITRRTALGRIGVALGLIALGKLPAQAPPQPFRAFLTPVKGGVCIDILTGQIISDLRVRSIRRGPIYGPIYWHKLTGGETSKTWTYYADAGETLEVRYEESGYVHTGLIWTENGGDHRRQLPVFRYTCTKKRATV